MESTWIRSSIGLNQQNSARRLESYIKSASISKLVKCSNKTLKCDRLFSTLGVSLRFTLQQLLVSAEHGNNVVTKSIDTSDRLNRGLLLAPFQLILRSAPFCWLPKTVLMLGFDMSAVSAPRLSLCDVGNKTSQSCDIVISFLPDLSGTK